MKLRIINLAILMALMAAISPVYAAEEDATRKEVLKKRFIERNERLLELKEKGTVGETAGGDVEIVDSSKQEKDALEELQTFLGEENKDRQELYAIVASETEAALETVIKQSVSRKFKLASLEEYFKAKDGIWRQKKEMLQENQDSE